MKYFDKANEALKEARSLTKKDEIVYAICKNERGFFYIPYSEKDNKGWTSFANTSDVIKKKRGITIVIAYHNEGEQILSTIESIYKTANRFLFNIILVNDCSTDYRSSERFKKYNEIKYIYNQKREGVGASLTKGAYLAETPYLFLMGSDIRFRDNGWLEKMIHHLEKEENSKTLICTKCLVMRPDKLDIHNTHQIVEKGQVHFTDSDIDKVNYKFRKLARQGNAENLIIEGNAIKSEDKFVFKGTETKVNRQLQILNSKSAKRKYEIKPYFSSNSGCELTLFLDNDTNPKKGPEFKDIIGANWIRGEKANMQEISCIMGAAYGVRTDFFKHIKGWEGHIYWGTLEAYISLKSYLFGGNCKVAMNIETGHIFKKKSSHQTELRHLIYNKLLVAYTLFDEPEFNILKKHISNNPGFKQGIALFNSNIQKLNKLKEYYENNKTCSIFNVLDNNKIEYMNYFNKNNIPEKPQSEKLPANNYELMSLSELQSICKERGIKFRKNNKEETLIKKLISNG